jgi:Na+/H+ antiporter NhaD/arsenite permease-like protein
MGFVDWELLVLFVGLFVVNQAFESTGLARKSGIVIGWRDHARTGIPVTLMSLTIVWGWLYWL